VQSPSGVPATPPPTPVETAPPTVQQAENMQSSDVSDAHATEQCQWPLLNTLYSIICVLVMVLSFTINSRSYTVSHCSAVLSVVLLIAISFIPLSCNRFSLNDSNAVLFKLTLFNIVWFFNRHFRLTEILLSHFYQDCVGMLETYQHDASYHDFFVSLRQQQHHGHQHHHQQTTAPQQHDYLVFLNTQLQEQQQQDIIPVTLFEKLTQLDRQAAHYLRPGTGTKHSKQPPQKRSVLPTHQQNFLAQLRHVRALHQIHLAYRERRWFTFFFSWKNRHYDLYMYYFLDLARTIWILAICPSFLFFVFPEIFMLCYYIYLNLSEIYEVYKVRKAMRLLVQKPKLRFAVAVH
jgi:hypothetical protein